MNRHPIHSWGFVSSLLFISACCHNHVQLMFPIPSPSAEYYECTKATDEKPEARTAQCKRVTEIDPARENPASTQHVDMPRCANSDRYYKITILNADTAEPTVLVRCGQAVSTLHNGDDS